MEKWPGDIPQVVGVNTVHHNGVSVVVVTGEIDMGSVEQLRAELAGELDKHPDALVIDLDTVDFLGSTGVTALLEAHHRATENRIGFAVVTNTRAVLHTLKVTTMDQVLMICPTLDEAVESMRPPPDNRNHAGTP